MRHTITIISPFPWNLNHCRLKMSEPFSSKRAPRRQSIVLKGSVCALLSGHTERRLPRGVLNTRSSGDAPHTHINKTIRATERHLWWQLTGLAAFGRTSRLIARPCFQQAAFQTWRRVTIEQNKQLRLEWQKGFSVLIIRRINFILWILNVRKYVKMRLKKLQRPRDYLFSQNCRWSPINHSQIDQSTDCFSLQNWSLAWVNYFTIKECWALLFHIILVD